MTGLSRTVLEPVPGVLECVDPLGCFLSLADLSPPVFGHYFGGVEKQIHEKGENVLKGKENIVGQSAVLWERQR